MNFVRIIANDANMKQALFEHDGNFYMYSYVSNDFAHETMVFRASAEGEVVNFMDLAFSPGYMGSDEIMKTVVNDNKD